MQDASTAFGTIVAGPDATVAVRVSIGWPAAAAAYTDASLTVQSVGVTRETQTDMPAGTRLVAGRAAAQMDLTLGGLLDQLDETKTVAWLMGRYQSSSPLYRQDCLGLAVTYDAGVLNGAAGTAPPFEGVEFVRQFTGVIDSYTENPDQGTVAITCLDGRARLTTAPTITQVTSANTTTAEYAVDRLASSGGYSTWPRRSAAVLAVGFRASCAAEVGSFTSGKTTFAPGRFGTAAACTAGAVYALSEPVTADAGGLFCEFWASAVAGGQVAVAVTDSSSTTQVTLTYTPTGLVATLYDGTTTATVSAVLTDATDGAVHYVAMQVAWATSAVTLIHDATSTAGSFAAAGPPSPLTNAEVKTAGAATIEGLNVTTEAAAAPNAGFVPTAIIDPSSNYLTAMPDVTGQDAWQVIQDIADAEPGGAIANLDENGQFRYRTSKSITSTPVRVIDATTSLANVDIDTSGAALVNHLQVPINKLAITAAGSLVWAATDVITIQPRATFTQVITTDNPVIRVSAVDVRGCDEPAGNGNEVHNYLTTATITGANQVTVTIRSTARVVSYLVSPADSAAHPIADDGQPWLRILGQTVTQTGALVDVQYPPLSPDGGAAVSARGEKLLVLPANVWRQSVTSGQMFARSLLADLCTPRPQWAGVTIVADPRLQLGELVTLNDPAGSGIASEDAVITAIDGPTEAWQMTLTLRAVYRPGGWILGSTVAGVPRSRLGVSTYT